MKTDIIKAIALFGFTAAAAIIIAKYKKAALKKALANLPTGGADERHIPHGRHSIVKRRALEMLHAGN